MNEEKVKDVCASYRADIDYRWRVKHSGELYMPIVAQRFDEQASKWESTALQERAIFAHLAFVAEETPRIYASGKIEKAMRWLGWLQGVFWGLGLETLEDAKLRNMPDEEKGLVASQTVTAMHVLGIEPAHPDGK